MAVHPELKFEMTTAGRQVTATVTVTHEGQARGSGGRLSTCTGRIKPGGVAAVRSVRREAPEKSAPSRLHRAILGAGPMVNDELGVGTLNSVTRIWHLAFVRGAPVGGARCASWAGGQ